MLRHIFGKIFAYNRWIQEAKKRNIPVIEVERGSVIKNISKIPLGLDSSRQVYLLYILPDNFQITEAAVMEIPQNSNSEGHRHIYGEEIVVLSGSGYTEFSEDKKFRQDTGWNEGSYFFIPPNLWHRHFNKSDKPARFLAVTPAPLMINIFRNREALSNICLPFKASNCLRYAQKKITAKNFLKTCFIKDTIRLELPQSDFIGKDYRYLQFRGSRLRNIFHSTHIAELNSGTYIRAHKHGGEVFIYILSGKGYILLGSTGGFNSRKKIKIEKDDLINLPPWQYHQVFSTGDIPLRFIAFKGPLSLTGFLSLTEINYAEEDKNIKEDFEQELSVSGGSNLVERYRLWREKAEGHKVSNDIRNYASI